MNHNPTPNRCHDYVVMICALILSVSPFSSLAQDTLFVDHDAIGSNNGSDWSNAYTSLQNALAVAQYGDEIWVAKGTYFPTSDNDRTISFELPLGVKLYGSFEGTESSVEERDLNVLGTILSGNIGSDDPLDNTQSIVYLAQSDMNNLIDGFKIENGYANTIDGSGGLLSRIRSGGGIYLDYPQSSTNNQLLIRNSFFTTNQAPNGWGGAIYANKKCGILLQNCLFTANQASAGGAIAFNGGSFQNDQPDIQNCSFGSNIAESEGGAIHIFGDNPGQTIWIDSSIFLANKADASGGAINIEEAQPITSIVFNNNQFLNNGSLNNFIVSGGAVFYYPEFFSTLEKRTIDFFQLYFSKITEG